ncbi:MAG: bluetail domain-containing putative surface protein [Cyanobacteriota bacterium]
MFSGRNRTQALRTSLLRAPDRITDFNPTEGDRIQLDFDNQLRTRELPRALFNVGAIDRPGITTLAQAVSAAYADTRPSQPGNQRLGANQALFFEFQGQTFLSVNDNRAAFRPQNDLLVEVTGIQFRPGDEQPGVLSVRNYFA